MPLSSLNQLASGFSELAGLVQFLKKEEPQKSQTTRSKVDFRMPENIDRLDQKSFQQQLKQG